MGLIQLNTKPESTAPEAAALTTWPTEELYAFNLHRFYITDYIHVLFKVRHTFLNINCSKIYSIIYRGSFPCVMLL